MWKLVSTDGQVIDLGENASFSEPSARIEEVFERRSRIRIWGLTDYIRVVESDDNQIHVSIQCSQRILPMIDLHMADEEVWVIYKNKGASGYANQERLVKHAQMPRHLATARWAVNEYLPQPDGRVWSVQIAEMMSTTIAVPPGTEVSFFGTQNAHLQIEVADTWLWICCQFGHNTVSAKSARGITAHVEGLGNILRVKEAYGASAEVRAIDGGIILLEEGKIGRVHASAMGEGSLIDAKVTADNARLHVSERGEVAVLGTAKCRLERSGSGIIRIGDKIYTH